MNTFVAYIRYLYVCNSLVKYSIITYIISYGQLLCTLYQSNKIFNILSSNVMWILQRIQSAQRALNAARVHGQIGNWTEHRERHLNLDKLNLLSHERASVFEFFADTRRTRERERMKKKITATLQPLNWLETRQARKYQADELQFCRSNLKLFIVLPFLRKLARESSKSFEVNQSSSFISVGILSWSSISHCVAFYAMFD